MKRKDAYIEKAQARIDEYACKLDELKAKARGEVAGLKIDAKEQVDKLEVKLDAAKVRLAELTDSAEDKWEDLSTRFEVLADDLGASFRKFFEKH
jgi:predicted  nucleic acid-binding Zn-ribbon protein